LPHHLTRLANIRNLSVMSARIVRDPQETAALEHANFQLSQENAVKSELKAVLDSWVRYEQQQRESEQAALVQSVQTAIDAEIAKPAFKKQLLEEAVARVEALAKGKQI
jgi:F-type H+-transporting ATPase subunit b